MSGRYDPVTLFTWSPPPPSVVGFLTIVKMTRCNYQQQILSCNYKQSVQKVMNEVQKGLALGLSALPPAQSPFLSSSPVLGAPGEQSCGSPSWGPWPECSFMSSLSGRWVFSQALTVAFSETLYDPVYLSDFADLTGMLRNAVVCLLETKTASSLPWVSG